MTMRRIDSDQIDAGSHQRLDPLFPVGAHTHRRADAQTTPLVFAGIRILNFLLDVLDRDQSLELEVVVHHQELLDPVLMQNLFGLIETDARLNGDQICLWS